MFHKRVIFSVLILCLSTLACNLPSSAPSTEEPAAGDGSPSPTATFTAIAVESSATATFTPVVEACKPSITTNTDANVRGGPGTVYNIVGAIPQGGTAVVAGKSADGTWWYIEFPGGNGGYGWISGSITTAACIPATLAVIAAPPTPIPPTSTATSIPSATPLPTNTPLVLIPVFPLFPIAFGDVYIEDVFLSAGGEIVARIAISGTISGSFKYSVYVDGNLQVTKTDTLPVGSQAYYSGVVLPPDIFDQTDAVKVVVDPANALLETDEGNNQMSVSCNNIARTC